LNGYGATGKRPKGPHFVDRTLRGEHWLRSDLRQARFERCVIDACTLRQCRLEGACFVDCQVTDLDIFESALDAVTIEGGAWHDVTMTSVSLANARLIGAAVEQWLWLRCRLDGLAMQACLTSFLTAQACHGVAMTVELGRLFDTVWFDTHARQACFRGTRIERQVIGGGDWIETRYLDIDGGLATWHDVRLEALEIRAPAWGRLRWHRCGLLDTDLRHANLCEALAVESTFRRVRFDGARLASARLDASAFIDCDFAGAEAIGTSWRGSQLLACRLDNTRFAGSDWRFAQWKDCKATGVDTSGVRRHGFRGEDMPTAPPLDDEDAALAASHAWRQRHRSEVDPKDPTPIARRQHVQPSAI